MNSILHDYYAADYDAQVQTYECYIADLLFGLCYEYTFPGQCLLDVGIGSGLSARLFAQAGLEIHGFDFSPAMLGICQGKSLAADLKQHDIQQIPWPYPSGRFDHIVSCGVFHFLADLDAIFDETRRLLVKGGLFAFTTRFPVEPEANQLKYERQVEGDFEIYAHFPKYIETMLAQRAYTRLKMQRCFVGTDIFQLWVTRS